MIEAGLIAPLVNLLQNSEFDIKKEAAWAISNATSGGTNEQIKYVPFLSPLKGYTRSIIYILTLVKWYIDSQVFGESRVYKTIV